MKRIICFLSIIAIVGCSKKEGGGKIASDAFLNTVPSDSSGIDFSNDLFHKDDLNIIEYLYYYNGGGVAVGDINNDGLEDIYFTANQTPDRLYLNLGNLKFKDITESAGIALDSTWSSGVTMEDVNNDGYLDIYVCKVGNYKGLKAHNLLYLNQGNQTFVESSAQIGLDFSGLSTQATFLDYDLDGDLDMYLMNHSIHTPRSYGKISKRQQKDSLAGDRFFENTLNEGALAFKDVTDATGIYSSPLGYGLALVASDINNDGLMDIYVGNDFHENDYIYLNQGDKTFKESGAAMLNHSSRFTMGVDVGDLNTDGLQDIFSLDMMPFDHKIFMKSGGEDTDKVSLIKKNFGYGNQYARNTFQLNNGDNTFADVALMTETHATDWSWAVLIQDYDNDGLSDIYITNGIYKRPNDLDYINYLSSTNFSAYDKSKANELEKKLIDNMPTLKLENTLFRNKGNFQFENLSDHIGIAPSFSNGAAYGDLDNDGDLDIVVNNIDQTAFLIENTTTQSTDNNYVAFDLSGSKEYHNVVGSKVEVYTQGTPYIKELVTSRGFQSSSTRTLHFGLGKASHIDSVRIIWPDGKVQRAKNLAVNQKHPILRQEALSTFQLMDSQEQSIREFPYQHIENVYLDYEREALIPEKLSVEGPAVATADFNGDGITDLFIGGAKYQAPSFYLGKADGGFRLTKVEAFAKDEIFEDVDAAVFDLENDGDLDLYVMSGGNDIIEGSPNLEDRVYLNDGQANFKRLEAILPKTNGGSISSGDFNADGFPDLFIGSRSVPGAYGLSPTSLILKNTGNASFEVVANTRYGMVTDSQWTDLNNDQYLDLVIAGDWMPITVMINTGNDTFEDRTKEYGLQNTHGLWNSLTIIDIDGNGFKDIVAGNAGLNHKWKASENSPVKLYIDDFDSNGQPDPLIFYDFFGHYAPFPSKDNLMSQLPQLKKRFTSYTDFSEISGIEDLIGKSEDDISKVKHIYELRSMIYLNKDHNFTGTPLPKRAQMSTIQDIIPLGKNGQTDVLFVGNYFDYVTELGHSDANPGGILKGYGKGTFDGYKSLGLPKGTSARRIIKLNDTEFLVVANNGKAFSLEVP